MTDQLLHPSTTAVPMTPDRRCAGRRVAMPRRKFEPRFEAIRQHGLSGGAPPAA